MGFLEGLLESLESNASKTLEEKYRTMDIYQLKREWERTFGEMPYSRLSDIRPKSPQGILDVIYAERCRRKSWREMAMDEMRKEEARQREKVRVEKERQKELEKIEAFEKIIAESEMAALLLKIIDEKEYDITYVEIHSSFVSLKEGNREIQRVEYKKYGYPNLEEYQMDILTDFLEENLTLDFEEISDNILELNDAPGGMKESW